MTAHAYKCIYLELERNLHWHATNQVRSEKQKMKQLDKYVRLLFAFAFAIAFALALAQRQRNSFRIESKRKKWKKKTDVIAIIRSASIDFA